MKKERIEDYEDLPQEVKEIVQKVKEIVQKESSIQRSEWISIKELLEMSIKDPVAELESDNFKLPSATCVIDFDLLHIFKVCKPRKREDKIMAFDIFWGCVYPKSQLFVLEFWQAEPDTLGKIFDIYLTPQDIKFLIKILRKGLEYLKKYDKSDKKEEVNHANSN
jgi:hypothetical protein